jgi:hypothetical protein
MNGRPARSPCRKAGACAPGKKVSDVSAAALYMEVKGVVVDFVAPFVLYLDTYHDKLIARFRLDGLIAGNLLH